MLVEFQSSVAITRSAHMGERPTAAMFGVAADARDAIVSATQGSDLVDLVFFSGVGTLSSSGITVTGTGTNFITQQQLRPGGLIKVGSDVRQVAEILTDTSAILYSPFPSNLSSAAYSTCPVAFSGEDVGKIAIVKGAGSGSDRESIIHSGAQAGQVPTGSWTVVTGSEIDCQAATQIKMTLSVYAIQSSESVDWEVWGSSSSTFTPETRVFGPSTVASQSIVNALWTTASPGFRYYRIKIKQTTAWSGGRIYTSQAVFGRLLAPTIAGVNSLTQARLSISASATRASAVILWGTDDTAAWGRALAAIAVHTQGGDHGRRLRLSTGRSLVTSTIVQHRSMVVEGDSAGGSMIVADPARFPINSPVWRIGDSSQTAGSYFTRLENIRIDAQDVPGSIGIWTQTAQENSGIHRVTVVNWRSVGVRLKSFAVQHSNYSELWIYPGYGALADDAAIALELDQATSITRFEGAITVLAGPNFTFGYGTGVKVYQGNASFAAVHIESAKHGLLADSNAQVTCEYLTGHATVQNLVRVVSGVQVWLGLLNSNESKISISDTISGRDYTDYSLSSYEATGTPIRYRSNSNAPHNLFEWIPGSSASGYPGMVIDRYGQLESTGGFEFANPNRIVINALNFGGTAGGGFITVGTKARGFPNWTPTHPKFIFTANSTTGILTLVDEFGSTAPHGLAADTVVYLWALSGGSLPTGLLAETAYYVRNPSGQTLQLATSAGGSPINFTSNGSGELYLYKHGFAQFLRLGASRNEIRFGFAGNSQGTDPGVLVFRADMSEGVFIPWLNFDELGLGPMELGNKLANHRFRIRHGSTNQENLAIQSSATSGSSWADILTLTASSGRVAAPILRVNNESGNSGKPAKIGGGGDITSGTIALNSTSEVTVPGSTDDLLIKASSGAVGALTQSAFINTVITAAQAVFDLRYAQLGTSRTTSSDGTPAHTHTVNL